MDAELILTLLDQYGIPLVVLGLAIAALVWLGLRLLKTMEERIERSEGLVDTFKPSIDALTEATEAHTAAIEEHTTQGATQTAVLNALLDEWRRGK